MFALLVAIAAVGVPIAPVAAGAPIATPHDAAPIADASPIGGAPTLSGYFIVGNGAALVAVGYIGWLGQWTGATNGSQIYSNAFYLGFFNLRTVNTSVTFDIYQGTVWIQNTTVIMPAVSETPIAVTLPSNVNWVKTTFYFDGVPYWVGQVATPVSLLPNYILNIGGLDLLGIAIVSFMLVVVSVTFWIGKRVMARAGFAPKAPLYIWGHVLLFSIVGLLFVDYQFVDKVFAGWSPLIYPWAVAPLVFLWSLSHYNRHESVEILAGTVTPNNEMGWYRVVVRIAVIQGRLAYVGPSWGDMWARYFGHHAWAEEDSPRRTRPWLSRVIQLPSPTDRPLSKRRLAKAKLRAETSAPPLTRFAVMNVEDRDDVRYIAFAKSDRIPDVHYPRLAIHRVVTPPVEYVEDPADPQGAKMPYQPPDRRKLTWPHYVDPPASDLVELDDVHSIPAYAAWARFATTKDLGRLISKLKNALAVLSETIENRIQDEVEAELTAKYSVIRRATSGISDEEAAEYAKRAEALLNWAPKVEPKPPTAGGAVRAARS